MKNITIFLDTNVILDYLQSREPFTEYANSIFKLCADKKIVASISAQSIADIFFILRKDYTVYERKNMLLFICGICDVIGANKTMITNALTNENFNDLEDCIQTECAKIAGVDYIITRNIKDFTASRIEPILPEDFLKVIEQ